MLNENQITKYPSGLGDLDNGQPTPIRPLHFDIQLFMTHDKNYINLGWRYRTWFMKPGSSGTHL